MILFDQKFKIRYNIIRLMEPEEKRMIEALAVVDLDPSLTPFDTTCKLEQKWITSLQFTTDPYRGKSQFKCLTITPGLYLLIGFCQTNKAPIFEIDFFSKPPPEWMPLKISTAYFQVFGAYLCYKSEQSQGTQPLSDLQVLTVQRKSRFGQSKEVINVPTGYKLISHPLPYGYLVYRKVRSKAEQTFKPILSQKCPQELNKINLAQLPIFCFPEGIKLSRQIRGFATFNFIFTLESAERIYVNCLLFKESLSQNHRKKLDLKSEENIFYEKALCLISSFCYTDEFSECLQRLYRLSMSKNNVPFWKVADNFLSDLKYPNDVPRFGIQYNYGGPKIQFQTNESYPFVSQRSIYTIFKFLTVEHIVNVFQALLLEKKVFFVSQSKTVLGYASQAFTSLLFPFKWQQVLIPILSYTLKDYLNAPVPLIAGISPALVDSSIQSESLIVYLDRNQILNDEDLPPLPQKLAKQLRKRLQKLQVYDSEEVTEYLQNPQSTYLFKMQEVQDPHFHGNEVRDIFLQFLLTLMRNYKKFWNKPKEKKQNSYLDLGDQLMTDLFRVQDFLADLGMTKIGSFGFKFTQSSIFTAFIEKRQREPNNSEIKFFDACLEKRKAKKESSFILSVNNEEYKTISGPEPEVDKSYHYDKFPSLLSEQIVEEEIIVQVQEESSEKKILVILQEQYFLNSQLYQPSFDEFQDPINKQIHDLLLNKNKPLFPFKHISDRQIVMNWFMETYTSQVALINGIFKSWQEFPSTVSFKIISKKQYLVMGIKTNENQVVGVCQNGDYEILARGQNRILITTNGKSFLKKSQAFTLNCTSGKIKLFLNSIIPKQSDLLFDYCCQKMAAELKKSSFRTRTSQGWNIETIIDFYQWAKKERYDSSTSAQNH